jgi:NAD-dependent dihydropyrimidine dehydrogenase PreA subunit
MAIPEELKPCQFVAIEVDAIAQSNLDKCFGSGACVPTCPTEAPSLEEIRPLENIRVTSEHGPQ